MLKLGFRAILRNVGHLIRLNVDLLAEWEVRDNGKVTFFYDFVKHFF